MLCSVIRLAFGAVFLFTLHLSTLPATAQDVAAENQSKSYIHISLDPCYGPCPVYEIFAFPDDRIVFRGHSFTKLVGLETDIRQAGFYRELTDNLEKHQFWSMNDNYGDLEGIDYPDDRKAVEEACAEYWTDNPAIQISVRTAEKSKSITYYFGCKGFDDEQALIALIESTLKILDADKWI